MGTLVNPKTWAPYMNTKDCTQEFCSLYCPQFCYLIFSPPPPSSFPNDHDSKFQSPPKFSPLVITIIGILASAFVLVTYYAIVSKFCGNSISRRDENQPPNEDHPEEESPSHNYEPWLVSTNGLDETLIKNIALFKYKKEDGLLGSNMCSICLGEVVEDDTLRLLPKCSHAFHVACIDTWLKSHSNCPLCRASIFSTFAQPTPPPPPIVVDIVNQPNDHEDQVRNEEIGSSEVGREIGVEEQGVSSPKYRFRALSDLGDLRLRGMSMRRSLSMDPHTHETWLSISEMLRFGEGEDCQFENDNPLKGAIGESSKASIGSTSTRILLCKHGRTRNVIIPT